MRRKYPIRLTFNGVAFTELVIDSHYEIKHRSSVNDALIFDLVMQLDGESFDPDDEPENGYRYFSDDFLLSGKNYRLVWLIPPGSYYLGVVNAYRRHHGQRRQRSD